MTGTIPSIDRAHSQKTWPLITSEIAQADSGGMNAPSGPKLSPQNWFVPGAEGVALMRPSWVLLAVALSGGSLTGNARALDSDWKATVFPERAHDFGTVARGSHVRHAFPVVNRTNSEIRIAHWRTKCGCTDVRVGARVIPPGTQTTVEATIDTTKFQGFKASGLTLVVDRPVFDEIDLNMTCFIRGDITMSPGQIDFGTVRPVGQLPSSTLVMTYAGGRSAWEITDMKTQTAQVKAIAREMDRSADGQVRWLITATLQPGLSIGFFKDEITVITNDSPRQTVPVPVVANIQGALSVTPSIINFGPVRPGQSVSKVVRARSSAPFTISKLSSSRTELTAVDQAGGSVPDHTLSITLKAPATTGPYHAVVTVESDLKDESPAQIKAFATVVPAS
jgi:hypothetical protein